MDGLSASYEVVLFRGCAMVKALASAIVAYKRFQRDPELWTGVCRRRFLTIVLTLHRLDELLHYSP